MLIRELESVDHFFCKSPGGSICVMVTIGRAWYDHLAHRFTVRYQHVRLREDRRVRSSGMARQPTA
jgi:hypothetical protein